MRRNWTIRGLSIPLALLAVLLPSRSEAHGDPWPLVNAAENAAWGTLIHRSTSPTCELLVVAPGLSAPVSIPPVRLANPVVGLPEGTEVWTHGCGEAHPAVETADGVSEERNRRVEVLAFPSGVSPAPVEVCPVPDGCAEWAVWQSQVNEEIDL